MKKVTTVLWALILISACSEKPAGSFPLPEKSLSSTDVHFTLDDEIDLNRNSVWCKPMQLCWNEMVKQNQGPLKFTNQIKLFDQLNNPPFENQAGKFSFVFAGLATQENKDKVLAESKKLNLYYNTIKSLLDPMRPIDYFAYANYWMRADFKHEFADSNLNFKREGKSVWVKGFDLGHVEDKKDKRGSQVRILYHNFLDKAEVPKLYDAEYVVELKSKNKNVRLVLAQIKPRKTLADNAKYIIELIKKDPKKYAESAGRLENEPFAVPNIQFKASKMLNEFKGNVLISKNPKLNKQELKAMFMGMKFKLDKKGAEVKAEAAMLCERKCALPQRQRSFVFDKPFFVMVMPADKDTPDFICWIANPEILEIETKKRLKPAGRN